MTKLTWFSQGACRGVNTEKVFFNHNEHKALKLCESCPVRVQCLQYAILNEIEYGVWGGKTTSQRKFTAYHAQLLRRQPKNFNPVTDEPV